MKKIMTLAAIAVVCGLTACETTESEADYSYESQAPYADERTVGAEPVEEVFVTRQRK